MLSNNLSMAKNEKCIFMLSVLSLNSQSYRDKIREARKSEKTGDRRDLCLLYFYKREFGNTGKCYVMLIRTLHLGGCDKAYRG